MFLLNVGVKGLRVINIEFPLQLQQKYYVTQYEELGFSLLAQMKDEHTTNFATSPMHFSLTLSPPRVITNSYLFLVLESWENVLFELGSERVNEEQRRAVVWFKLWNAGVLVENPSLVQTQIGRKVSKSDFEEPGPELDFAFAVKFLEIFTQCCVFPHFRRREQAASIHTQPGQERAHHQETGGEHRQGMDHFYAQLTFSAHFYLAVISKVSAPVRAITRFPVY